MEIGEVRLLSLEAVSNLQDDLDIQIDEEIKDETNLLEILDSMDIVNLIMETESLLEKKLKKYTPLANEHTFDAESSPLTSFKNWIDFISSQVN